MIEPNRNDLRVGVPRDQFITALQTQQRSRAFQLALGKKTDDLALGNFLRCSANGGTRIASIDWNTTQRPQNRVQNRFVIMFLVDDVSNRARASELQNERVNPGDVVRQKEESALWKIFQSKRSDPVKATHQQPTKEIEGALSA